MKRVNPILIRKILFITLSNIGDAILTLPSLDLVRRFFPKAHVTVMVGPRAQEVFQDHPQVDQLLIYDKHARLKEKLSLVIHLKEERFDLVIDLRHTLIPLLIQPRFSTPLFRRRAKAHAALRHLKRLETLGIKGSCTFILPQRQADEVRVKDLLSEKGIKEGSKCVVLAPGAASPLKRWDLLKFKELGERLKRLEMLEVVIVGAAGDCAEFKRAFPDQKWMNLTGELSLMQLGELIKRASLFITNDSGPMHLAAALGTPVLALFGPTDPQIYGPYGNIHRVVRLPLDCSPCMSSFCRISTHKCLKALEVDQVYEAACQMLDSRSEMQPLLDKLKI